MDNLFGDTQRSPQPQVQLPELSVPAGLPHLSCSRAVEGTRCKFPWSVCVNGGWKGAIFHCRISCGNWSVWCHSLLGLPVSFLLLSLPASESSPNFSCLPWWEPPMRIKSLQGAEKLHSIQLVHAVRRKQALQSLALTCSFLTFSHLKAFPWSPSHPLSPALLRAHGLVAA